MKVSLQEIIQQLDERPLSLPLYVSGREQLSPRPVLSRTELGLSLSAARFPSFSPLRSPRGPNEPLV